MPVLWGWRGCPQWVLYTCGDLRCLCCDGGKFHISTPPQQGQGIRQGIMGNEHLGDQASWCSCCNQTYAFTLPHFLTAPAVCTELVSIALFMRLKCVQLLAVL